MTNKVAKVDAPVLLDTLQIKASTAGSALIAGSDYEAAYDVDGVLVITLLDDGTADVNGNTMIETGNILMDNATGRILGFIGGRNFDINQNNHAFNADRQVGSTIKPISVYGPAIAQGIIGSESRLANYPTTYADGREFVNSTNVDLNQFVTVRKDLNWSFNNPDVHVNNEIRKNLKDEIFFYNHY